MVQDNRVKSRKRFGRLQANVNSPNVAMVLWLDVPEGEPGRFEMCRADDITPVRRRIKHA